MLLVAGTIFGLLIVLSLCALFRFGRAFFCGYKNSRLTGSVNRLDIF